MRQVGRRSSDPVNRRVAVAMKPVLLYLDMLSLLTWRSTCLDNYVEVNRHLRESLHKLLQRFLPDPVAFLQMFKPWGALIVGEAALSQILHDPGLCTYTLEIAIGNMFFQSFLNNLSPLLISASNVQSFVVKPAPTGFPYRRHISRIAEYRLPTGLVVVVYESTTPSASDVVCGYWTTAMMNFVNGHSFACAYPRLTFNRLSLVCDTRLSSLAWCDYDVTRRLTSYGFQYRVRCGDWPLYSRGPTGTPPPILPDCGKSLYVCPFQGRYFGDQGSLVGFYDGFGVDLQEMKELCVAPFGPMVTWRLPSRGLCTGICVRDDCSLPPFIVSMITQFMDTPRATVTTHSTADSLTATSQWSSGSIRLTGRRERRHSIG